MADQLPDFPIDPGFVLAFPCFVVESRNGRGGVVQDFADGLTALAVFTDEDVAERFCKQNGYTGNRLIQFAGAADVLAYLDILPPQVTHVAFDSQVRQPVDQLRRNLMERLDGRR